MTKQRFEGEMTHCAQIYDNEGITWALETRGDIREFCKLLNALDVENKELKKENQQLRELLEDGLEVSQVEIDEELKRENNMNEKRFEIDSKMYGATDVRYWLKDNANELVDGYGDEIYWGDGSSNGLKQIVNKLNELVEKNEKLQYKLRICEDARQSYKQDWKACSSYCDEYKSKINSLEDEVEGLIEENEELKKREKELLYQIGRMGKNNKTCRECECFISKIGYCYMWDMAVKADDVVPDCDQRKEKNGMISDD